jgi:hypothetical protein
MNALETLKSESEYGSSETLDEKPKERKDFSTKTESSTLADLPHRATTVTPLLTEMLARVEGVARWGLNE